MKKLGIGISNIKSFSLFTGVDDTCLKIICNNALVKNYKRGDVVYSKTDSVDRVLVVLSGKVKIVQVNENGFEITKEIIDEGDLFGAMPNNSELHFEYAEVLTPKTTIIALNNSIFNAVLKTNTSLTYNYSLNLQKRLHRIEARYLNLAFCDVKDRLIYILKELAEKDHEPFEETLTLQNYLTQDELAKMIFVSRQTLSRVMKELKEAGEISYKRNQIKLRNKQNYVYR